MDYYFFKKYWAFAVPVCGALAVWACCMFVWPAVVAYASGDPDYFMDTLRAWQTLNAAIVAFLATCVVLYSSHLKDKRQNSEVWARAYRTLHKLVDEIKKAYNDGEMGLDPEKWKSSFSPKIKEIILEITGLVPDETVVFTKSQLHKAISPDGLIQDGRVLDFDRTSLIVTKEILEDPLVALEILEDHYKELIRTGDPIEPNEKKILDRREEWFNRLEKLIGEMVQKRAEELLEATQIEGAWAESTSLARTEGNNGLWFNSQTDDFTSAKGGKQKSKPWLLNIWQALRRKKKTDRRARKR